MYLLYRDIYGNAEFEEDNDYPPPDNLDNFDDGLITVTLRFGEQIDIFAENDYPQAVRVLQYFVKSMNPEEDDAAVFNPKGLVANAKDFLDENDHFTENVKQKGEIAST